MRWAGHVARMGENRNIYGILIRKDGGNRTIGRHRHREKYHVTMILKGMGWFGVDPYGSEMAGCCKHGNETKLT